MFTPGKMTRLIKHYTVSIKNINVQTKITLMNLTDVIICAKKLFHLLSLDRSYIKMKIITVTYTDERKKIEK